MTWIKTIPQSEADDKLRWALDAQRALYPKEYATPVQPTGDADIRHRRVAHPDPRRAVSRLLDLRRADVTRAAADAAAARDDHDDGLRHQSVPVLNHLARRVSASGHVGSTRWSRRSRRITRRAPIGEQDRVMLDYVVQLTRDATRLSPSDHERLRARRLRRSRHPSDYAHCLVVQLHQSRRGRVGRWARLGCPRTWEITVNADK